MPAKSKPGLYANINKRKKAGTTRSKKNSTVSKKSYIEMKKDFGRKANQV